MATRKQVVSILLMGLAVSALMLPGSMAAEGAAGAGGGGRSGIRTNADSTMGGTGILKDELDDETRERTKRGLEWLAKHAAKDLGAGGYGSTSIAITALAGIAFLAGGNMPGEGPYGKEVDAVLDTVIKNTQETGLIAKPGDGSPMYDHGFATLFLAEVYGMTHRADVKEKLQLALRLIVSTQNKEGGWQYQPQPLTADTSATICQVMALRAARNAGIHVPRTTIDNAMNYTKRCQNADGGYRYMLTGGDSRSGWARTSASTVALYYMGKYEGTEIERAAEYLKRHLPGKGQADDGDPGAVAGYMFFYGNYYMCQTMFMLGGEHWAAYWPLIKTELVKRQQKDGNWTGEAGEVYATSMALIILQVPNRLLPILQK